MPIRTVAFARLCFVLAACDGARMIEDAGSDGAAHDAFLDAVTDVAVDVPADLGDASPDGEIGPRDCVPLLAADAVPATYSPR